MRELTKAEEAIKEAIQEVEKLGVDPKLTDIVLMLQSAQDELVYFLDKPNTFDAASGDPVPPDPTHPKP